MLHMYQRPSEFENIGEGIAALSTVAGGSGEDPWFGACSRCATAHGYYVKNTETGGCVPVSCIDAITIRPLKEILDRFIGNHPILAHSCGGTSVSGTTGQPGTDTANPILTVMITNTPYVSEWTFGGLSMAVAACDGRDETRVIFIEQGVYSLCGNHEVTPEDRVFNVQEMVEATSDITGLHYYVYSPSLAERGLDRAECLSSIEMIDGPGLGALLGVTGHANNFPPCENNIFLKKDDVIRMDTTKPSDFTDLTCQNLMIKLKILLKNLQRRRTTIFCHPGAGRQYLFTIYQPGI